jgi:hypothetical protein
VVWTTGVIFSSDEESSAAFATMSSFGEPILNFRSEGKEQEQKRDFGRDRKVLKIYTSDSIPEPKIPPLINHSQLLGAGNVAWRH